MSRIDLRPRPQSREASSAKLLNAEGLVVADYFCGAGGFTCGALRAGAKVACGIDSDARVRDAYTGNNRNPDGSPVPFLHSRVEELPVAEVLRHVARFPGHARAWVACPPCQPFSKVRTKKMAPQLSFTALGSFLDHVGQVRPEFVVIENVPGIRGGEHVEEWENVLARLRGLGYGARVATLNAARFGVPQKRIRTLLVATRSDLGGPLPWPRATHSPRTYRTVRDALSEVPLCKLEAGGKCETDSLHAASALSPLNLERIRAIREPGGSRTEWPESLWLRCYRVHSGHTDVYGRMHWDRPAPTLTTRFVSLSNGRFGHPEEDRAITPREGALLQTFPRDYMLRDPSRDVNVAQIGNAVPPDLAAATVRALRERIGLRSGPPKFRLGRVARSRPPGCRGLRRSRCLTEKALPEWRSSRKGHLDRIAAAP